MNPMDSAKPSDANIQLMQLTNAFWTSRCLHVVAETGVADHLNEKSESTDSLAQLTGTHPEALYRVLRLLASQGIFAWKDGAWVHTEASRLLRGDHPASMRDYIRMIGMPVLWHAWEELEYSVRTGKTAFQKIHPAGIFAYFSEHPEQSRIFNASMTSKAHRDIAALLPAYDFSQFQTIADIGGGRGHLLRAILKQSPNTNGILFDQPQVVAEVKPEPAEKLRVVGGNFFTDRFPVADAYLLMNIIHDWNDADSIKILSGIRRDMSAHARVLVIETVVPATPGPHYSKELDIVMMAIPGGKERTQEEYSKLASHCGFRLNRVVATQSPYSALEMQAG